MKDSLLLTFTLLLLPLSTIAQPLLPAGERIGEVLLEEEVFVEGQVAKDTFSDFSNWVGTHETRYAALEHGPSSQSNTRIFMRFVAPRTGKLESATLAVHFDNAGEPVNFPSANPYKIRVHLFESLSEVINFPETEGPLVDAPSNTDWATAPVAILDGFFVFEQIWKFDHLNINVQQGHVYYLSIYADRHNWSANEVPMFQLAPNTMTDHNDYAYYKLFGEPFETTDLPFPAPQFATKITVLPNYIVGDVNGDGEVNGLDIAPFVEALTTGGAIPAADIDGDGAVTALDIAPFVALLTG